jgi:hypothetical protein
MRLIDNKKDIIHGKITERLYWDLDNIFDSDINIFLYQRINVRDLTQPNNLKEGIYNEINR